MKSRKIILAASGASGVVLANRLARELEHRCDLYFITTPNSHTVASKEQNITLLDNADISAPTASGSFGADAMIVAPCSMNTLAKIACGIADNLVTRSAAVMLKEQKKLILAPREMPFSAISLENMLKLSRLGVIIAPPVVAYYSNQQSLEEMESFLVGKWLDLLGLEHNLYKRWQ
ncbi:MAG: UbiX family flavin prenyltransferase [Sulfuricurvum sp.]